MTVYSGLSHHYLLGLGVVAVDEAQHVDAGREGGGRKLEVGGLKFLGEELVSEDIDDLQD